MSTATPRPQLNLDEMRRLKWLLGGLVSLISLWTVFFLDVEALSLVVITSLLIVSAIIWPQLPAHVPMLVWRLSVPAIIVTVVADLYFSPDTLPSLIRLAVLLVLYRAMSYRRKREDLQLIVLSLFLIVVAGVLTVALGFAFLLLLFTACALGFLFSVTLIDMTDTGPKVMRPEEMREVPGWARLEWRRFFVRLRQVADWRLIGFAGGLFVLVVGFSALLFLLIPRFDVGSGFFLDKYITRKSRTGFSETIKFGSVSELVRDESVVMRVDLANASALQDAPYWRLIVLDEYTATGFRMSAALRGKLTETQQTRSKIFGRRNGATAPQATAGNWTFFVEPEVSRFLPLPGSYGVFRLREALPVQHSREQKLIALRSESMAMVAFQLEGVGLEETVSDPEFARQFQRSGSEAVGRSTYDQRITLATPEGLENRAALERVVAEIAGGEKLDARAFAQKATQWLRARHSYALSSRIPSGSRDDIVKWLDSNEPGFCEYFAASLTVLCRAAGHPARVVAGFHGGILNAFENYYMVRNSDAHAWAEVFDGRAEWFRVDATPGASAAGQAGSTRVLNLASDSSWSARFDSLRVLWYRRIVNFDARQQEKLKEDVVAFTSETGLTLAKKLEAVTVALKKWLAGPWNLARAGKVLQLIAGVIILVWALTRAWHWTRLAWRMWRQPGRYDPVRSEAGHWLEKIARVRTAQSEPDELIERVHGELLHLRYGRRETWPEPHQVFRRARRARRAARRL